MQSTTFTIVYLTPVGPSVCLSIAGTVTVPAGTVTVPAIDRQTYCVTQNESTDRNIVLTFRSGRHFSFPISSRSAVITKFQEPLSGGC